MQYTGCTWLAYSGQTWLPISPAQTWTARTSAAVRSYYSLAAAAAAANVLLLAGWMEEVVVTKMIDYLKKREADGEPFFLYYPSFSVHA
jgi:hypothetical protein